MDLKLIKRHYGEKMMHLCRELFPSLLETPGLLYETLTSCFAPSKLLYDDIEHRLYINEFRTIILQKAYNKTATKENTSEKTPQELLDEAGYILYECKTKEDIEKFKKYYVPGEELCTFSDPKRLYYCYVFFAVKKNVDKIKRENFPDPKREDEYGTSVISIQFTRKRPNTISIKNRYNHTVYNPDATFGNNLENIIEGLTESFEKYYDLNINQASIGQELFGYILTIDKRYYKSNYEIDNVYYCPNNVIIDNFEAKEFDKSRYIVFDYFILDMQEKKIIQYNDSEDNHDSFIESIPPIEKIEVLNNDDDTKTIVINNQIIIKLDRVNEIIEYINPIIEEIKDNFLNNVHTIKNLELENVKKIGDNFCKKNNSLKTISLPNVETIGNSCMEVQEKLKSISLPKVKTIGNCFLLNCCYLESIDMPNVETIGDDSLVQNYYLKSIYLPNIKTIGKSFLMQFDKIETIDLPLVEEIGKGLASYTNNLETINAPKLDSLGETSILVIHNKLKECNISIELKEKLGIPSNKQI